MDVLLCRPPSRTLPFIYEDLGLEVVAGSLRDAGIACRIDDGIQDPCSPDDYVERLASAPERVVGLTLHSELVADRHLDLLARLKRRCPDKLVIVGGHPAAAIDAEIAEKHPGACDVIVRGEGERTAVELLRRVERGATDLENVQGISFVKGGRWVRTGARARGGPLRPLAARDAWERPGVRPLSRSALVAFSQGCNHRCTFCSVAAFHGPGQDDWRARPIDEFLGEVSGLLDRHGVSDVTIVDPNFIGCPGGDGEALARDFCDAIHRAGLDFHFEIAARIDSLTPPVVERLRDAGLLRIFVGIESGQAGQLEAWRKRLSPERSVEVMRALVDAGVYVEIGMIVLQPHSTLDDVRANIAFLRRLPYFNLYNLDQALWPLHLGDGRFNLDEGLLDAAAGRIFRTYAFRDDRVRQFAAVCAGMGRGLGSCFYHVRQHAWDNLARVPGMLRRFCDVQRGLLEPYLAAVDEAIALIAAGAGDDRIAGHVAESVERLRPAFGRVAAAFTAEAQPAGTEARWDHPA